MKKKIVVNIFLLMLSTSLAACSSNSESPKFSEEIETQENSTDEMSDTDSEELIEDSLDTDEESEESNEEWSALSCTDFENGIAFITQQQTVTGDTRTIAIDEDGYELFTVPEVEDVSFENTIINIDDNGEYVWFGNVALNRNGEIIYDITDKYSASALGNGYMLVQEKSSGYEQKIEKMGVIDGYGNEIIPISEEFAELCGEELLNVGWDGDYRGDGIGFDRQTKLLIDANQGVYYDIGGDIEQYKDGNVLVYGNVLYKDKGTSEVRFDDDGELTLSKDKVISLDTETSDEPIVRTYDLNGNLLNETTLNNIALEDTELKYDNGNSALYIDGADGCYVTMIDEKGNFKFEPIKHTNHEADDSIAIMYGNVSEGLLRVALDEYTTIFVNENGETVLEIPYSINYVGNCKNSKISINTGMTGFYADANTGKYIESIKTR